MDSSAKPILVTGGTGYVGRRLTPRLLAGILYRYVLLPTHRWLFEGMLCVVAAKTSLPVMSGPDKAPMTSSLECRL